MLPPSILPQSEASSMSFYLENDPIFIAKVMDRALATHECGHAVCALASGVEVLKIQNGVRKHFAMYNMKSFPNTQVRKTVAIAGPLAESEFLKQLGLKSSVCSGGDAAHLLGNEDELGEPGIGQKLKVVANYSKNIQVARLKASLDDHLMDGKDLPHEFQHLRGLIKKARINLMEHQNENDNLVAALFNNGGVLRKNDIQRIWQTTQNAVQAGRDLGTTRQEQFYSS